MKKRCPHCGSPQHITAIMRQLAVGDKECSNCFAQVDLLKGIVLERPSKQKQEEAAARDNKVEVQLAEEMMRDPRQIPLANNYVVEYLNHGEKHESFNPTLEPIKSAPFSADVRPQNANDIVNLTRRHQQSTGEDLFKKAVMNDVIERTEKISTARQMQEKSIPHHAVKHSSANPFSKTISDLEQTTPDSERWALDLLREEEVQFALKQNRRAKHTVKQLNNVKPGGETRIEKQTRSTAKSHQDTANIDSMPTVKHSETRKSDDQWEKAMRKIGIEETWVLQLFDTDERVTIAKELITAKLHAINCQACG